MRVNLKVRVRVKDKTEALFYPHVRNRLFSLLKF